ncbi:UBP-type zinc finger domain-containing protein [Microbacterium sp. SLBN-146]|uniref:UBP-type zinc finger domain-containing protein n=1 Tax=Microbacterium sp. SLBN-146 TaxID=2768457 RepID=UPI001154B4EB|nr:UBP-type zinc finger domain-containing protein [Microbacterium sp. SLBN-146]TQJ31894.1 ubiquitin-hydrolase Zn-finger-containing protein [Microbacterium sp. SLBN-146]
MDGTEIDPAAPPSGDGCVECEEQGGWWVHLRRCATCGHIGCCDQSPGRHATAHFHETAHRFMRTYEPGESWFWDYADEKFVLGPALAPPLAHPADQPTPAPADRVPENWREIIAE